MAGVVPGHKEAALWMGPYVVSHGRGVVVGHSEVDAHPGSQIVRDVSPADVDGVLQLLRTAGMQEFDRVAGGSQLRIRVRQSAEVRAVLKTVATQNDPGLREERGAGIPDYAYGLAEIG